MLNPSAPQLRMARAALEWSLHDVQAATGLTAKTVRKLETGDSAALGRTWPVTMRRLTECYERHGITFEAPDERGDGVRYDPSKGNEPDCDDGAPDWAVNL